MNAGDLLVIPRRMEFTDWEQWLRLICQLPEKLPFVIGDLLCAGEDWYGEKYAQGIDPKKGIGRFSAGVLANYKWVARRIKPEERETADISWSWWAAIAPLERSQRDAVITHALREGWARGQLRAQVKLLTTGEVTNGNGNASQKAPEGRDGASVRMAAREAANRIAPYAAALVSLDQEPESAAARTAVLMAWDELAAVGIALREKLQG